MLPGVAIGAGCRRVSPACADAAPRLRSANPRPAPVPGTPKPNPRRPRPSSFRAGIDPAQGSAHAELKEAQITAFLPITLQQNPESRAAEALGDIRPEPSLEQVLQERDEAIAKKQAVEAELDSCRARLRTVEAQLLEVLQEKLRLKQEVESWEEDMQQMVRERVQSQLQRESRAAPGPQGNASAGRSSWIQLSQSQRGRWW
ncbi:BICD family-like cargo adapter 1 [Acomys russatus]|uniref:BICD family-like cargo adapter 1 n=1 Tax=Acomys russatus TaxID=60746 RepID=UPI0021E2FFC5|nr:BICD family-like cargo adapter 1 [Acomys russatus]